MSLPVSLFVPGDSWLHRLDPRVKLGFALLSTVALMLLESLPLFLLFLLLCHVVLLSARVPLSRIGWAWRLMLPVTVLIPLLWPLFSSTGGAVLVVLGPLVITWSDIWWGLAMAARVNSLAFAFFVWLFTTDQTDMVLGFVHLGLPYDWGLTVAIALRYIPTLQAAFEQVMEAQRARGLVIPRANPVRAARAYVPALVPTLIVALRTADDLSRALEARAFGAPGRERTARRQLRFTAADGAALLGMLAVFAVVVTARLVWQFGRGPLL